MQRERLTIGRLARAAGVTVTTVRYYQQRGLLREPKKPPSGKFRSYNEGDLSQLRFIKNAKELGFTLSEIARLLEHVAADNCHAVKILTTEKLETVRREIGVLQARKAALRKLLEGCSSDCSECRPESCALYRRLIIVGE